MSTDDLVAASNQIMLKVGEALARTLSPKEMGILILNKMFGVPLWKIPEERKFITHMLGERLKPLIALHTSKAPIPPEMLDVMYNRIFDFLQEAYKVGGLDVKKLIMAELATLRVMDIECGKMKEQAAWMEEDYQEWVKDHPLPLDVGIIEAGDKLPTYLTCLMPLETVQELVQLNVDCPFDYPITPITE